MCFGTCQVDGKGIYVDMTYSYLHQVVVIHEDSLTVVAI